MRCSISWKQPLRVILELVLWFTISMTFSNGRNINKFGPLVWAAIAPTKTQSIINTIWEKRHHAVDLPSDVWETQCKNTFHCLARETIKPNYKSMWVISRAYLHIIITKQHCLCIIILFVCLLWGFNSLTINSNKCLALALTLLLTFILSIFQDHYFPSGQSYAFWHQNDSTVLIWPSATALSSKLQIPGRQTRFPLYSNTLHLTWEMWGSINQMQKCLASPEVFETFLGFFQPSPLSQSI